MCVGTLHACSASQSCPTLQPHELQPARLLCPWNSPCQNTGAGCHFLLQGIFATQGLNPCLLHCRQIFFTIESSHKYLLIHKYQKTQWRNFVYIFYNILIYDLLIFFILRHVLHMFSYVKTFYIYLCIFYKIHI